MRRVYEDPEHTQKVGARAAQFMRARHSAVEIGRHYRERLCELELQLADLIGPPVTVSEIGIPG
jgi:hypothetical protein